MSSDSVAKVTAARLSRNACLYLLTELPGEFPQFRGQYGAGGYGRWP